MAAAQSPQRPRALAFTFAAMMMMTALGSMVPTAVADHEVDVTEFTISVTKNSNNLTQIVNQSRVTFRVVATVTGDCVNTITGATTDPSVSLAIPLGPIGTGSHTDTNPLKNNNTYTFNSSVTAIGSNTAPQTNEMITFTPTVTATCGTGGVGAEADDIGQEPATIHVRIGAPAATAAASVVMHPDVTSPTPTANGINATLTATISIGDKVAFNNPVVNITPGNVTLDLTSLGGTKQTWTSPNDDIVFPFTLLEYNTDGPISIPVAIKDAADNYRNFTLSTTVDQIRPTATLPGAHTREVRVAGNGTTITPRWTTPTGAIGAQIAVGGTVNGATTTPGTPIPLANPAVITLTPFDKGGNLGLAATNTTHASPAFVSNYIAPWTTPTNVALGGVGSVTLTGVTNLPADFNKDATVTLERIGGFGFWNGNDPTLSASYTTANPAHYRPTLGSTATSLAFDNFTAKNFPDGNYKFNVTLNGSAGNIIHYHSFFRVDAVAPTLTTATAHPSTTTPHATDGNPVNLTLAFDDARPTDSQLRNITVELIKSDGTAVVVNLSGNAAQRNHLWIAITAAANADDLGFAGLLGAQSFNGVFHTTFPNLTVGDYKIRFLAYDQAGNERVNVFSEVYKVRPRVSILQTATTPFLHANGVEVVALAGFEAQAALSGKLCDAATPVRLCHVTNVSIFGRNAGEAEALLATVTVPKSGQVQQGGLAFFNYSTTNFLPVGTLNATKGAEVRAVATVTLNGVDYTSDSGWVRLQSPEAPSLSINKPTLTPTTKDWFLNTTGTVLTNVTFEYKASTKTPDLNYTVRNLDTGVAVDSGTLTAELNAGGVAPKFLFNYTKTLTGLATGEYVYHVEARDGATLIGTKDRYFAVALLPHFIIFPSTQNDTRISPTTAGEFFVQPTFDLAVRVDHGPANITSDSNFSFRLRRAEVLAGQTEFLTPGQAGFTATVKNHSAYEPNATSTYVNVTVTLPSDAFDGQKFVLNVTAETDTKMNGAPYSEYTRSNNVTFTVDNAPPTATLNRPGIHNLSRNLTDPLVIYGLAEDAGAGVQDVEVRLTDVAQGATFKWDLTDNGLFAKGTFDSFMSSNIKPTPGDKFVRNVYVNQLVNTPTIYTWQVNGTDRPRFDATGEFAKDGSGNVLKFGGITLDRAALYRVDVRVTDRVGHVSSVQSEDFRFDGDAPKLLNATNRPGGLAGSGPNPTTINWHSTALDASAPVTTDVYTTNVSDNQCVKSVVLKGRAPSGAINTAQFERPAGYVCNATLGNSVNMWRIDLAKNPHMTNEVGTHNFWVEAEDPAGLIASVPQEHRTMNVNVTDTFAADVAFEHFEPPFAQVGGSTTLRFEIEENKGLDRIDIYVVRRENNTDGAAIGPISPRPDPAKPPAANGTGAYMVDTAEDLNLDLKVGEYRFEIRPVDWQGTGCNVNTGCANRAQHVLLQVVSDAAPSLIREAPASGTTFVNLTPEFRFRVVDPTVETSGITLQVGNSVANLSSVTPTYEALASGANRTGYRVTYKADLAGVDNFTLRLRATDTTGLASVETYTFAVDGTAPSLEVNLTGNETGPDGLNYAVDATRIELNATDELSGLAGITYSENNGTARTYSQPIIPDGTDGAYELRWTARDNASNIATGVVHLRIDKTGPSITSSNDPKNGSIVKVTASDAGVGLNESTLAIRYAFGTASIYSNATFTKESGNLYTVTLPKPLNEEGTRYYVEALDMFGNKGTLFTASSPKVISIPGTPGDNETVDLPPVVTITSPVNNALANGSVELAWNATDPEGAPLTITIALREPTGPGRVLVESGENTGAYSLDVRDFEPGTYTLVVSAIDSTNQGTGEVTFRIAEATTTPPPVPVKVVRALPTNIKSGDQLTFAVQLDQTGGKTIQSATFKVVRDGAVVSNGTLVSLATGYSGTFAASDAGQYSVLVSASYTDGSTLEDERATTFNVQQAEVTTSGFLPTSLILLLILGMLTVALAAYAAFVRWGK